MLSCVAPNVNYHILKVRGMIHGVAVPLHQFLEFLDKCGIPHKSEKSVRKKVKRNKCVGARTLREQRFNENLYHAIERVIVVLSHVLHKVDSGIIVLIEICSCPSSSS